MKVLKKQLCWEMELYETLIPSGCFIYLKIQIQNPKF